MFAVQQAADDLTAAVAKVKPIVDQVIIQLNNNEPHRAIQFAKRTLDY